MSVSKLGILTQKYRRNFGGILQCYALQEILKSLGFEVVVINFETKKTSFIEKIRELLKGAYSFKEFVVWFYEKSIDKWAVLTGKIDQKNINSNVLDFISEYLSLSKPVNEKTIYQVSNNLDAIIIGSDRVWNGLTNQKLIYFFDWIPKYKGIRMSYAACTSNRYIPHYNRLKIRNLIHQFDYLSVRDLHTKDMVLKYAKREPKIVLDPTFLYDFSSFVSSCNSEPYIFMYVLGRSIKGGHNTLINEIKKVTGITKIITIILPNENMEVKDFADTVLTNASPKDWVSLIANSSFVYTDSFHASIFSIKFKKPFIAYYTEKNRASRLLDLRDKLVLPYHYISDIESLSLKHILEHDYRITDQKINQLKKESISFLKQLNS